MGYMIMDEMKKSVKKERFQRGLNTLTANVYTPKYGSEPRSSRALCVR
jgi:hypothetical protein